MRVRHRTTRRTNLRGQDSDFWNLSKGIFSVALVRNLQTIRSNVSCSDGNEKRNEGKGSIILHSYSALRSTSL